MSTDPIPSYAIGIGLRGEHCQEAVSQPHPVDWYEVHSENYFGRGGAPHSHLKQIRANYPLSFHGVGLSLGSADPLDRNHLRRLKQLIGEYQPALVSEHLSWSSVDGVFLHDLLPLPMTEEAIQHLSARITETQDYLGCQILVENASTYLEFSHSQMPEWEFVNEISARSGCGILLDINNIFVNASNHEFSATKFIDRVNAQAVGEIHLAGHTLKQFPEGEIRIDTHNQRVCDQVWELYDYAIRQSVAAPTLIEWDKDLPEFSVLLDEAAIARSYVTDIKTHAVA